MNLLILGGTRFVGRHLTEAALARDHEVTLFNRGQSNPDLFPNVEQLHGDRDGDLAALEGRTWDVVIDTCGYVPRVVRQSAELLADAVERYIFISSISVYADPAQPALHEGSALGTLDDPTVEKVTNESYGPLKVLCEQAAEEAMPGRVLQIRPGLIVGPHDPTDRFTYWVWRVAQGGEVLAPADPAQPTQFIDARDLAAWTVHMAEQRATGIFNATGPADTLSFGDFLATCRDALGTDAQFTWVSEEFLREQGVAPWSDLPLWVPREAPGLLRVDIARALGAGLHFHPLAATVRDTYAWAQTRDAAPHRAGISREREAELLAAWHALD